MVDGGGGGGVGGEGAAAAGFDCGCWGRRFGADEAKGF